MRLFKLLSTGEYIFIQERLVGVAGKLQELTHEMDRYRWNILGLCEMRWKNFGETGPLGFTRIWKYDVCEVRKLHQTSLCRCFAKVLPSHFTESKDVPPVPVHFVC